MIFRIMTFQDIYQNDTNHDNIQHYGTQHSNTALSHAGGQHLALWQTSI
jgi:hypothetical protein